MSGSHLSLRLASLSLLRLAFTCMSLLLPERAFAAPGTRVSPCAVTTDADKAMVVAVSERLELRLSDGRVLRLAGVEAPEATPTDPELATSSRIWLEARIKDKEISFQSLDSRPDRWGRVAALVFEAGFGERSLQEALLGEGLARVVADQSKLPCEARLLAAARLAQAAERGLWRDPYYAVIPAGDRAAFAEHSGSFVEAQGRLSEIKPSAMRLMMVFGPPRRGNLVVTVLQRNVKNFENAGLHFQALIGQTLRVRGLLETRFGPEIEVARPNDIEVVAHESDRIAEPGDMDDRP